MPNNITIKKTNRKISILFFTIIIIGLIATAATVKFTIYIRTPFSSEKKSSIINIRSGMSTKDIAKLLEKNNLISKVQLFIYLTFFKGKASKIQAGEYNLSHSMTPLEILEVISSGKTVVYLTTIPEGLNFVEISNVLSLKNLGTREKFLSLKKDTALIDYLNLKTESLEGYLFPDTYRFNKGMSEYDIVKKMISTYKNEMPRVLKKRAKELGLTEHQVITLASLVEKETGAADERGRIAAVFHNRLKKNMKLQCDPTVIYAIGEKFDGNIRKKDLKIDSPYNTYKYRGLPPGPIASPGLQSIQAVLYPEDVNFLYFVSKRDGTHHFSTNYQKHTKAVRKYQLRRSRN